MSPLEALAGPTYSPSQRGHDLTPEGALVAQEDRVVATHNVSRRESIGRLVDGLRAPVLRELAADMLDAAFEAVDSGDLESLRSAAVSWLETTEISVGSRKRVRGIMAARDEGRARFGSRRPSAQERRSVP